MTELPCGCVDECEGHRRGSDEWWAATLYFMERGFPEKFTVRLPSARRASVAADTEATT